MLNFLSVCGKRSSGIVLGAFLGLAISAMTLSTPLLAKDKTAEDKASVNKTADAKTADASKDTPKIENPPFVTRGKNSDPTPTATTLHFKVRSEDTKKNLSVFIYYGTKDGVKDEAKWDLKLGPIMPDRLKEKDEYTVQLKDLEPATNYFYAIRAEDRGGVTWSDALSFTTARAGMPLHLKFAIFLMVVAAFVLPFWVGNQVAKRVRMPEQGWRIGAILCAITFAVLVISFSNGPSLGIDLSGGVIMVYEIDTKATEEDDARKAEVGNDEDDKDKVKKEDQEKKKDPESVLDDTRMKNLLGAIEMRVNPGGLDEVSIRQYGPNQIEITIPKADAEKVKRIQKRIVDTGTLEFRILATRRNPDHLQIIEIAMAQADSNSHLVRSEDGTVIAFWVPVQKDREDEFHGDKNNAIREVNLGGVPRTEVLVVRDPYEVTGALLRRSTKGIDQGSPCVHFSFNSDGARRFGALTGEHLPEEGTQPFKYQLGIVLNDELYSAPTINSRITSEGMITGRFTDEEAQDLVDVLNAGSLPAKLRKNPISEWNVGPTLGRDTIERGKVAITSSVLLVLVFMAVYYRFAGLVACGALIVNMILLFAIMIGVHADFTLPGIAGLVLTVGMAVDANVLIFERMREELGRGAALRMAIRNGFAKATTTIVDANVTTLITAIILYIVGTQQIKGFAITLILGIVLSMFTAIFCSRVVFDIAERRRWITNLKMMRFFDKANIDFVRIQKLCFTCSLLVICIGIGAIVYRGRGVLDIDFTGGESVTLIFKNKQDVGTIRKELSEKVKLPDLTVNDATPEGETPLTQFIVNTSLEVNEEKEKASAIQVLETKLFDFYEGKLVTHALTGSALTPLDKDGQPMTQPGAKKPPAKDVKNPKETPGTTNSAESTALADEEAAKDEEAKSGEEPEETAEPSVESPETPVQAPAEEGNSFAHGTMASLTFSRKQSYDTIKTFVTEILEAADLANVTFELTNEAHKEGEATEFTDWTLLIALPQDEVRTKVIQPLGKKLEETAVFPSSSSVGSRVAQDFKKTALVAIIGSLICIIGYIWIRFQQVIFGLAAVVALVHDVSITIGAIALSAFLGTSLDFLGIEGFKISLSVLAAILTIIGYSLNDTIVVFDRIREVRGKANYINGKMINTSINQTLSRTILTSLTTLIVVVVLYFGGGDAIHAFSFTLLVGIVVGTYSSIFIAAPLLQWLTPDSDPTKK